MRSRSTIRRNFLQSFSLFVNCFAWNLRYIADHAMSILSRWKWWFVCSLLLSIFYSSCRWYFGRSIEVNFIILVLAIDLHFWYFWSFFIFLFLILFHLYFNGKIVWVINSISQGFPRVQVYWERPKQLISSKHLVPIVEISNVINRSLHLLAFHIKIFNCCFVFWDHI